MREYEKPKIDWTADGVLRIVIGHREPAEVSVAGEAPASLRLSGRAGVRRYGQKLRGSPRTWVAR